MQTSDVVLPDDKDTEQKATETQTKNNHIHKIPSQPIPSSIHSSNETTIKINNSMEKIQYTLMNNWIENGFIENIRGQIRCQLIRELRDPFKHQKGDKLESNKSINHLSLSQRILNSIIINYLERYSYNYSLSVFKSEIGGELIGSLSLKDTLNQLDLNQDKESKRSILEYLIDVNKCKVDDKQNEINETERVNYKKCLEKERNTVKELQKELKEQINLIGMNESTKLENKEKNLNNFRIKYEKIYKELMETLKRENELQCLLDERNIKLKSANREINYLEKLLTSNAQNNNINIDKKENKIIQNERNNDDSSNSERNIQINKYTKTDINNVLSDKYQRLELDLKKRLQIQAMLETDTKKLTVDTKQFLNQLNEQKNKTNAIINKLENTAPRFDDNDLVNKYINLENEWNNYSFQQNIEKKEEFESKKRKNRQSFIYHKLQKERDQIQQQIRKKITLETNLIQIESKESDIQNTNESECLSLKIEDTENDIETDSVCSKTNIVDDIKEELTEDNDDDDDVVNKEEKEDVDIRDGLQQLQVIEEDKDNINIDVIDDNERDRLEREKLEKDLMDDDYTQSESFSGIDFMQNDFLMQYQKHIENMNNE